MRLLATDVTLRVRVEEHADRGTDECERACCLSEGSVDAMLLWLLGAC
jgi:hypothetical protein